MESVLNAIIHVKNVLQVQLIVQNARIHNLCMKENVFNHAQNLVQDMVLIQLSIAKNAILLIV